MRRKSVNRVQLAIGIRNLGVDTEKSSHSFLADV